MVFHPQILCRYLMQTGSGERITSFLDKLGTKLIFPEGCSVALYSANLMKNLLILELLADPMPKDLINKDGRLNLQELLIEELLLQMQNFKELQHKLLTLQTLRLLLKMYLLSSPQVLKLISNLSCYCQDKFFELGVLETIIVEITLGDVNEDGTILRPSKFCDELLISNISTSKKTLLVSFKMELE